jgi:DNA-binding transcriptional LysR family regulator
MARRCRSRAHRGAGEAPDRPSLAVGCFVTLGPSFVPRLIADFMAAQPKAEIRLHEGTQDSLRDGLGSGRLDAALSYDLGLEGRAELEMLAEVPPHVLLPPQHPLAGRERISLAELVPEPMILLDIAPSRTYFTGLFRDAGLDPWVRYHSPSFEMVRGMVGHGLGYSLLATRPAMDVAYDGKPLIVRPLADEVAPARIVVARPSGANRRPVADAFVDCCRSFFAARRQH